MERSAASAACLAILDNIADGGLSKEAVTFGDVLSNAVPSLQAFISAGQDVSYQDRLGGGNAASTLTVLPNLSNLLHEIETVLAAVNRYTKATKHNRWLVSGEAGNGKSHLLATVVCSLNSEKTVPRRPFGSFLPQ